MTPEEEISEALSRVRSWVADALLEVDKAQRTSEKREKRLYLLHAGGELHAAVRYIEMLLKTEAPHA